MSERNEMIDSSSPITGSPSDDQANESLDLIVTEVDNFAREWIGRIRRLIHRSSQLIERESLLANAMSRFDRENAEFNKRSSAKEEGLKEQAKRLTAAWLDVEVERRKALQGARAAVAVAKKATAASPNPAVAGGPVVPAPAVGNAAAQAAAKAASQMPGAPQIPRAPQMPGAPQMPNAPRMGLPPQSDQAMPRTVASGPQPPPKVKPIGATGPQPTAVSGPIAPARLAPDPEAASRDEYEQAEAASRQRIEEFKRMQRAIHSNRNT
ncbi:hypothetical protein NHH03_23165 [Stieleria sp. TO1_6]|uniref:hypothetical protein n=1 Tax=Stieleria tagensis TaxID=2956795 RepID=UPI00209AA3DB|nr:hypothetical protein [Stieleria tagensis]MCO8124658.1 hypothetical protein [Stieleria tagensis]